MKNDEEIIIPESKLEPPIYNLMSLICDLKNMEQQMGLMNYDLKKCPLGKFIYT